MKAAKVGVDANCREKCRSALFERLECLERILRIVSAGVADCQVVENATLVLGRPRKPERLQKEWESRVRVALGEESRAFVEMGTGRWIGHVSTPRESPMSDGLNVRSIA